MDFDCFIFDLHDLYLVCLRPGCAHVLLASRGSCINGSYLLDILAVAFQCTCGFVVYCGVDMWRMISRAFT